jgi:hypothetical protein
MTWRLDDRKTIIGSWREGGKKEYLETIDKAETEAKQAR